MNKQTIYKIVIGPFAVAIFHIIATVVGWYEMFWWFDIPMHFLGGVVTAYSSYAMLRYFESKGQYKVTWKPLHILLLLGLVSMTAVSWEFMEYAFDLFFQTHMQAGIMDTLKDICMGLIGGGLVALVTTYLPSKK